MTEEGPQSSHFSFFDLYEQRRDQSRDQVSDFDLPEEFKELESGPTTQDPATSNDLHGTPMDGLYKEFHRNQSDYEEGFGSNLLQRMVAYELHHHRVELNNIFFPFHEKKEWQLIEWFGRSLLSQVQINSFLQLDIVSVAIRYITLSNFSCAV